MIELDINTLTAAEVSLIEDTIDGLFAERLGDEIISFEDILEVARWLEARRGLAEGVEPPEPPRAVAPKVFKVLSKRPLAFQRALELAVLRRTNPAATWADTGQSPLVAAPDVDAAPTATPPWPSPQPAATA